MHFLIQPSISSLFCVLAYCVLRCEKNLTKILRQFWLATKKKKERMIFCFSDHVRLTFIILFFNIVTRSDLYN